MKQLAQAKKNILSPQYHASQKLIAELEARLVQLTGQLLTANSGLEHAVTERQRLEEKFQGLLELTPHAVVIVDEQGRMVLVNSQTEQLFGYSQDEMLGWPVENLLPERFRDQQLQHRADYTAKPQVRPMGVGLNLFGLYRDGHEFPIEISLSPLTGEGGILILVAIDDITPRKQAEDEFRRSTEQLRELSARLQSIREEERTRIARAIHDELGQTLTGLKMDVAWLQRRLDQQQQALLEKTRAMSDLIDITVQTVRRISTELRPGILDDLGLVATIEWQLQEFQTRTGIEGKLISAPEETTLDADGATTVFRIFQEILTNVARHAYATQVEAMLEETTASLTLQVQDNGRGITESEIHSPKSIGLLGMQERARLWAGEVQFHGTPGKGTTVTVWLPLSIDNC